MDAIHENTIKGMYILGENPAMSDPDLNHAREALQMLEHLVVQDIFLTETATYADVIFPASAWPEKNGTVTNTNRQVQMGRKALDSPGEAKEDWWITNELGKRMGLNWEYKHPKEIYEEMSLTMPSLSRSRVLYSLSGSSFFCSPMCHLDCLYHSLYILMPVIKKAVYSRILRYDIV